MWQKIKNLDGCFEVKNFSLFKENQFMESKIAEYGIILLHKYKIEKTAVISRQQFTSLLKVTRTFGQIGIYIFLILLHTSFTVTSLGNIHPSTF